MNTKNGKERLLEVISLIDKTHKLPKVLNETKAFGELRKSNKSLYDETIKIEENIGDNILNQIDDAIKKSTVKHKSKKEYELMNQIILDLLLSRFLDKIEDIK